MRDYLKEMQEHYAQVMSAGTGEKKKVSMTFCPSTWNKPCKLCDICKEVLFHQDSHTAEKIEAAREINRKPKFYANVILASNPSEVLLFEYGKTIGDKLGVYEMDGSSDIKGFTNPRNGRNMVIVRYPHPDKRKTRYDIEPRMALSPLPDMEVLKKLYNLDDVPSLLASGKVQPLYQSKLTAQRTEIRWLPSWLGPQFAAVFQVRYFIHYHISEDELAAIQRGEMNPLEDQKPVVLTMPDPVIITPTVTPVTEGRSDTGSVDLWSDLNTLATTPAAATKPGCFGTYDDDPLCNGRCAQKGLLEECKKETKALTEKRRQARSLYRDIK